MGRVNDRCGKYRGYPWAVNYAVHSISLGFRHDRPPSRMVSPRGRPVDGKKGRPPVTEGYIHCIHMRRPLHADHRPASGCPEIQKRSVRMAAPLDLVAAVFEALAIPDSAQTCARQHSATSGKRRRRQVARGSVRSSHEPPVRFRLFSASRLPCYAIYMSPPRPLASLVNAGENLVSHNSHVDADRMDEVAQLRDRVMRDLAPLRPLPWRSANPSAPFSEWQRQGKSKSSSTARRGTDPRFGKECRLNINRTRTTAPGRQMTRRYDPTPTPKIGVAYNWSTGNWWVRPHFSRFAGMSFVFAPRSLTTRR